MGAHAGLAVRRAERRRLRLLEPLAATTSRSSAELGFDAYRFSLEWSRIEPEEGEFSRRRARPLPAHVRRVPRARASSRSSPSITSRRRAGWRRGRLDRAGDGRRVRPLLRARPRRTSATSIAPGLHDQRAEHRRDAWATWRAVPARAARRRRCAARSNDVLRRRAPQGGATRSVRRAGRPGRAHARDVRLPGRRRRRGGARRGSARRMEDVFLDGTRGRRLHRRADVHAHARRSRRRASARGGRAGARRWATSSGPRRSRRRSGARGTSRGTLPLLVTENGIGTDDDDAAHRVRQRGARGRARVPSPTASTCAATSTGACSTTSSGRSATAHVRARRRRPHHVRAHPEAERPLARRASPKPTPCRLRLTAVDSGRNGRQSARFHPKFEQWKDRTAWVRR